MAWGTLCLRQEMQAAACGRMTLHALNGSVGYVCVQMLQA